MIKSTLNFNTILAILIVVIATTVLVFQRVDVEKHAPAYVGDVEYARGEVINSGNEYIEIKFADSIIYLDKLTEVKIINGQKDNEIINVIQGRVVIFGKLSVQTRALKTNIEGIVSFVHYSWLDKIEIAPLLDSSIIEILDLETPGGAIEVRTLPEYNVEQIKFIPEKSSASEFYERIFKKTAE